MKVFQSTSEPQSPRQSQTLGARCDHPDGSLSCTYNVRYAGQARNIEGSQGYDLDIGLRTIVYIYTHIHERTALGRRYAIEVTPATGGPTVVTVTWCHVRLKSCHKFTDFEHLQDAIIDLL